MRKMKKINGYLVVRFNDREKREDETLGSFGVIDAEEYTGDLEMDRSVMEYDDADSLEVAVEQARSLNAEEDYTGLPATCTVIRETDRDTEMNQVDPQLMISGWTAELEQQVKNQHYPDVDAHTAAHELYGYKVALNRLGLIDEDDCIVKPDTFGTISKGGAPATRMTEAYATAERNLTTALLRLQQADCKSEFEAYENQVVGLLRGFVSSGVFTEEKSKQYRETISQIRAQKADLFTPWRKPSGFFIPWPDRRTRDTFEHLPPEKRDGPARQAYSLGCALSVNCPENDCRVYLNTFQMCREIDEQLDRLEGWPRQLLEMELRRTYLKLEEMLLLNYAVREYRRGLDEGKSKEPPQNGTTPCGGCLLADKQEDLAKVGKLFKELESYTSGEHSGPAMRDKAD